MAPPKTQKTAGEGKAPETSDIETPKEDPFQDWESMKLKLASIDAEIEKAKMASGVEKAKLEARVMAEMKCLKAESAAVPELQMDGVHADWCQEDQRQDEFLKERKETAELADPKAIKVVPVQCQAVPEVEAKSVANALPTCPAVQLNDVPAEQYPGDRETVPYPGDRETVPVREKEAVANALPTCPAVQLNNVPVERYREDREMIPVSEKEAKTTANVCLTNFARQEVPVPETDPVSNKNRDIVVQDLCGTVQVWQKHQNELKAAAAADLNKALQQPTERTVVKAQHCSCPAEDRAEVLNTRLKRKFEGTGGGQSGIKMKGSDMHYLISVCSGRGHCKNVLYDKMTKPYHKRGKVVKKARGVKPQAFDLAERGKFRRKFTLPNVVSPSKVTTALKGQLNLAMSEHECPARIWITTKRKPYWRDKGKIYPVLRAPTSKDTSGRKR
uniref:Uncharacterized protein n=1 Tax=Sphaerodactylus townsendi TaxID=933632 RepID=A0ACB8G2L4_9SAUR